MNKNWMVIDVESIGLHGEGFAVGVVQIVDGVKVNEISLACHPVTASGDGEGIQWVMENCKEIKVNCSDPQQVRSLFLDHWMIWREKHGAHTLIADCAWPVEANFLRAVIADNLECRKWLGPYPLHDLASMMLARGKDPLAKYPRLPNELPEHNPLNDARQSARILMELGL